MADARSTPSRPVDLADYWGAAPATRSGLANLAHPSRSSTASGTSRRAGPLTGCRVIELAGIGPVPFAAMLLADMGADVIRVDRIDSVRPADPLSAVRPPAASGTPAEAPAVADIVDRGRRSIAVDLKSAQGAAVLLRLAAGADVVVEGFRPGVAERLGIGPEECRAVNPALVYGRMTGWGQDGPYAQTAGHDINFLALAGTLSLIGRAGAAPTPPLNLVADYGGGAMMLAFGVLCALLEARGSGHGQVVDASMLDGTAVLTTVFHTLAAQGRWAGRRGTNLLDSGAPFYDAYECADGRYLAVGALEPRFYALLRKGLGLDDPLFDDQHDRARWPRMKKRLAAAVRTRTRDEWCEVFEGTDACVTPVLTLEEAMEHPHNTARGTFAEAFGVRQPAPAPRLSRSPGGIAGPPPSAGRHTAEILRGAGYPVEEIALLRETGTVA
jgi:alpha-methylacyl-CoA racemase